MLLLLQLNHDYRQFILLFCIKVYFNSVLFNKNVIIVMFITLQLPLDDSLTLLPRPTAGPQLDLLSPQFSKLTEEKIENAQQVKSQFPCYSLHVCSCILLTFYKK